MGKSMTPSGTRKKVRCKCGLYYFQVLVGSSGKLSTGCSICKPEQYVKEEK